MKQNTRQVIDTGVAVAIFTFACVVGKMVSDGSWKSYSGPELGILVVDEL